MRRHVKETDLALYFSGDLSAVKWAGVRMHMAACESCRERLQTYRQDRNRLRADCAELPPGLNWDRLAAEMTANIRVGLAAGECVAPRTKKHIGWAWKPVAIGAGATLLLVAAFWLNLPANSDTQEVMRSLRAMVHSRVAPAQSAAAFDEGAPVVEATPNGIEWRENGTRLRMTQGEARPVAVSVDGEGSASARYIDTETGQITITSVYAQ